MLLHTLSCQNQMRAHLKEVPHIFDRRIPPVFEEPHDGGCDLYARGALDVDRLPIAPHLETCRRGVALAVAPTPTASAHQRLCNHTEADNCLLSKLLLRFDLGVDHAAHQRMRTMTIGVPCFPRRVSCPSGGDFKLHRTCKYCFLRCRGSCAPLHCCSPIAEVMLLPSQHIIRFRDQADAKGTSSITYLALTMRFSRPR